MWTIFPFGTFSVSSFFSAISSNPITPFLYKPMWFLSYQSTRVFMENCMESWPYPRRYPIPLPSAYCSQKLLPICYQQKRLMVTFSLIARSFENCGAIFLSYLRWVIPDKLLDFFFSWRLAISGMVSRSVWFLYLHAMI